MVRIGKPGGRFGQSNEDAALNGNAQRNDAEENDGNVDPLNAASGESQSESPEDRHTVENEKHTVAEEGECGPLLTTMAHSPPSSAIAKLRTASPLIDINPLSLVVTSTDPDANANAGATKQTSTSKQTGGTSASTSIAGPSGSNSSTNTNKKTLTQRTKVTGIHNAAVDDDSSHNAAVHDDSNEEEIVAVPSDARRPAVRSG